MACAGAKGRNIPNMRVSKSLLIILCLLTVACESEATPTPARPPTENPSAQVTSSSSAGEVSTPFQSSSTAVSIPTSTPRPLASPILVQTTPTPSAPENYQLKPMSSAEAQANFEEAYDYILAERQSGDSVQATIIYGEELLVRYPELHQNAEFLLHLAYLQAQVSLTPSGYSTAAFLAALEIALNSNQVQPSQLDSWLEPYGFVIAAQFGATNLFGDGQQAQVLHIESVRHLDTMMLATDATVVILSGESPGEYRFTPLRDTWLAYNLSSGGGEEIITVGDRNGNGRPDIASIVNGRGHANCRTQFSLYEWQGNRELGSFVNIAPIPELWAGYLDYNCTDVWHFSPPGTDGTKSIIQQLNYHNLIGEDCTGFQPQQIYSWNGTEYVVAGDDHIAYDESQPDKCRAGWAYYAPAELAIPVFEPIRDRWLPEYDAWGIASQDFLLFKLGVWYALVGEQDSARLIMDELMTNPPTPQYTLIPRLATVFLSTYQSQADLYAACTAVIQTAQADLDANPPGSDYVGSEAERLKTLWGFFDRRWHVFIDLDVLCDRFQAFDVSVSELDVSSSKELETGAEEHQIPLFILAHQDFTNDNEADWLVGIQRDNLWHLHILTRRDDVTVPIPIPFSTTDSEPTPSHFEILNPSPDSGVAYIVQAGEELIIFQMDELKVNILLGTWGVADYTLLTAATEMQIMVERTAGTQDIYTWNGQSNTFEVPPRISPEYEQVLAIQEIRHTLFELGDAQSAVTLLETLLSGEIIEQG